MQFSTLLITILFVTSLAAGQTGGGTSGVTVRGTVHDPSGAALSKARLKLRSGNGSEKESRKTVAEDGRFVFENVPAGEYVLKTEAKGFESATTKIGVGSNPVDDIKITLNVLAGAESITVSASRKNDDEN